MYLEECFVLLMCSKCPLSVVCRDTVIYSASCVRFGNQKVALKVYNKERLAATKIRAIKREIAMMIYFQKHRCALSNALRLVVT